MKLGTNACNYLARVVWKVDNTIHRINHYPVDSVVVLLRTLIHWRTIYPVDNVIQPFNNWDQISKFYICIITRTVHALSTNTTHTLHVGVGVAIPLTGTVYLYCRQNGPSKHFLTNYYHLLYFSCTCDGFYRAKIWSLFCTLQCNNTKARQI